VNAAAADGHTALLFAAQQGSAAAVQLLLDAQANMDAVDCRDLTALHLAAFEGHTAVVQMLLDVQASVNAADTRGYTALHLAAREGRTAIVQLLLKVQAAVNASTLDLRMTALHLAVEGGTQQWFSCCLMQEQAWTQSLIRALRPCSWHQLKATLEWCSCCWMPVQW
jgi:ankyrin repeat protein